MPDLTINVEIFCATCGDGLCNQSEFTLTRSRQEPSFRVEACQKCIDEAKDGVEVEKNQEIEELRREIVALEQRLENQ